MRVVALLGVVTLAAGTAAGVPPFGLGVSDPQEPIAISADKLEASEQDGVRTLSFEQNVEVRQGTLTLRARRLEARYPQGERQPEWLRARGDVEIREGEREARCDEASYDRRAQRIVCRGAPAMLRDGEDQLSGPEVVFELGDRRVSVEGGTEVEIHRSLTGEEAAPVGAEDEDEGGDRDVDPGGEELPGAALERLQDGGPVTIAASRLEAQDPQGRRSVRFHGDVRVRQGDLTLDADALEVVYPPSAGGPERLLAEGDVVIAEGAREGRCERADYRLRERLLVCEGGAWLRNGRDELSGERIAFDVGARRVEVVGDTRLRVESGVRR